MTEWDAHFRNNPRSLKTTQDVQIPGFFPGIWDSLGRELQVVATSTFGCYTSLCVLFEDAESLKTLSPTSSFLPPSVMRAMTRLAVSNLWKTSGMSAEPVDPKTNKNRTLLMDDVEFVGACWLFNVLQIPPK